jgi:hypothetical protein
VLEKNDQFSKVYSTIDEGIKDSFNKLDKRKGINLTYSGVFIVKEVDYYSYTQVLSEVGGFKVVLTGFALVFTSIYLKWMEKELYKKYGEKKGYLTF